MLFKNKSPEKLKFDDAVISLNEALLPWKSPSAEIKVPSGLEKEDAVMSLARISIASPPVNPETELFAEVKVSEIVLFPIGPRLLFVISRSLPLIVIETLCKDSSLFFVFVLVVDLDAYLEMKEVLSHSILRYKQLEVYSCMVPNLECWMSLSQVN